MPPVAFKASSKAMRIVGRSRKGTGDGPNEDSIGWDEDRPLAFVADGMGGYANGEVASRLVKETLLDPQESSDLRAAALRAHSKILEIVSERTESSGMGSTLVAFTVADCICRIVWVGDSRAYLWRRKRLRPLTRDHSFAERLREVEGLSETAMRVHPGHNLVLQALGRDTPIPSENAVPLRNGDWLLLCSDGLSGELRDQEIAGILAKHAGLESAADALVNGAVASGGKDDISVVLAEYSGPSKFGIEWLWGPRAGLWLSILAGVLSAALIAGIYWWFERRH
jgi:serine/threonine protein phosphatase PrpC